MRRNIFEYVFYFFMYLFFRLDSLLYSLPAWAALILHFTVGLSIKWFWIIVVLWLGVGILRYSLVMFGRWASSGEPPVERENKNPYSYKNDKKDM